MRFCQYNNLDQNIRFKKRIATASNTTGSQTPTRTCPTEECRDENSGLTTGNRVVAEKSSIVNKLLLGYQSSATQVMSHGWCIQALLYPNAPVAQK